MQMTWLLEALKDNRLSLSQYVTLRLLSLGNYSVRDINNHLAHSEAATCEMVQMLDARGLVRKVRLKSDERKIMVRLTDAGRELMRKINQSIGDE